MSNAKYDQALERLFNIPTVPSLGLERMRALLDKLDNPQRAFDSVHIAGTNGKGSTCAFAESILRAAGHRTGLLTSPHLSTATERIRVDGQPVAESTFANIEAQVGTVADEMSDLPTFFERITAMAFVHFREMSVQTAVVEVGLGGRLDGTNVIDPKVCCISRIDLDHKKTLGGTKALIATEKAGIVKHGVPMFSSPGDDDVVTVFDRRCGPLQSPHHHLSRDVRLPEPTRDGVAFYGVDDKLLTTTDVIGLAGAHQLENAALAAAALDGSGLVRDADAIKKGIAEARWPGRHEWLSLDDKGDRTVLIDAAHNANAAIALARALKDDDNAADRPLHLVIGTTRGHSATEFARALVERGFSPASSTAVCASAPRSIEATQTAAECDAGGLPCNADDDLPHAVYAAMDRARADGGFVLVTGSLYLVGEVRAYLLGERCDRASW